MAFGQRPRVILADGHAMVADGIRLLLQPYCEVLAVVGDGQALIDRARALRPEVVIAEIAIPLRNGIDAIRVIRRELPGIKAICLTGYADRMYVAEAIQAGANGYVVKHAPVEELRKAIVMAIHGRSFISPLAGGDRFERIGQYFQLTARQRQVLQLTAEGHTMGEIAALLGLRCKTVEFHKYRTMEALGLRSTAELVQLAVEHGLVSGAQAADREKPAGLAPRRSRGRRR